MKTRIKDYYLNLLVLAVLAATGGAINIALNKPATQISEEGSGNYPASRAVNGVKTERDRNQIIDYSQTGRTGNVKWWKVELEGEYFIKNVIIYNRLDCCRDYLSNVYILTSSEDSPADPSPVSDNWIIRHYKHGQVAIEGSSNDESFNLYTTDKVRHVALYLYHSEPLTLREVEIYNYSHSEDAPVNQIVSGTAAKFSGTVTSPGAAVDGNTNTFSAPFTTVDSQSSWVVKLKQSCSSFCYVRVYPRLVKNQFNDAGFTKLSRLQTLTYHGQTLPGQNANLWTDNCDIYEFSQKGPLLQICEATAIWFIRLVNSGQGQIQFTEVQVFSREPAEFQSIKLQNQNYGCINISTSPATVDRATSYRFKCAGKDWSDRSSSTSVQSCGHVPGSTVTCQVVAVGEGGVNQSEPASVNLADCQAPSEASFTVRDIGTNADKSYRIIKISNIMVEFIRCNSLISLGINVDEKNGGHARYATRTTDLYQDETIGDVKAYTDYTVFITAINNRRKISYSVMEVKTGELAPGPITSLTVQGNSSSCVNVGWSVPNKPNGVITSYKINCTNKAEVDQTGTARQVCDYNPYQTVTCTVRAVNSFSGGELTTANGFTWCGKPSTPTFILSQGTSGSPPRRFITVTNIAVEKINCRSLTRTNIKVYKGSVVVYDEPFNNQNSRNISGLDAVTQYRITVTVSNDGSRGQTESVPGERNIATGKLPPGPVASLTIIGQNSTCVNVNWTPPDKPNGAITSYKINCTSKSEVSQSETSLRVCGYNSYQNVTCTVRPVNSFSDGEQKTATGNTFCDKPSAPTFRLSQGTSGFPLRRFITVSDITVQKINCRRLNSTNIKVFKVSVLKYNQQFNDQNNRTISGLDAVTQYKVVVTVSNDRIGSPTESDPREQTITTQELPPGVVSSVSIWSSSPSCVNLSWSEPAKPNGVIHSYSVQCGSKIVENLAERVRRTSRCGFNPYQSVLCTIAALNNYTGVPISRNTTTQCDNPTPPNFTLYETLNHDKSKRVIHVADIQVEQHKCESLNEVEVTVLNGSDLIYQRTLPAANTSGLFGDLTAVTNFAMRLIVVNNRGNRSQPATKYITTGELAPWSPPARIGLYLVNSTCGILTWDKPLQSNGIILYYQVRCNNGLKQIEESLTAADQQYQFCGLRSASLVECSVRANNTIGWSPSGTEQGYTTPELKDPLQLPELKPATDGINIRISAVTFNNNETKIGYYQIIVERVSMRKKRSTDGSLVDVDFLYNSNIAQTLNLTYYITARLYNQTNDIISFTCGDSKMYGGYFNQPLETEMSYQIHYTYSVVLGDKLITYIVLSAQTLKILTPPVPPSDSLINLSALVTLLLIPAVVIIYILIKRRRNNSENKSTREDNTITRTRARVEQADNTMDSRPDQQAYENIDGPNFRPQSVGVYSEIEDPRPSSANTYMKLADRDDNDHLYTKKTTVYENRRMSDQYINAAAIQQLDVSDGGKRSGVEADQSEYEDVSNMVSKKAVIDDTRPITVQYIQLEDVGDREKRCGVEADQPEYEDVSNMQPAYSGQLQAIAGVDVDFASNVKEMNRKLYDHRSNPYDSSISREFQDISKQIRNASPNYVAGNKHSNVVKNADPTILPAEYYRVKLGRGSDNYINAITVGSFDNNTEFIVTQTPLQNTIEDFWLMVHEQRIVKIVQLEITEGPFIPGSNGESLSVGNLTIRRSGTQHNDNVETIQLEISPPHVMNGDQWSGEITVFRYTDWNDGEIPDEQSLISLYLIIKQEVIRTHNSSTVVMCRDGGSKCGVYVNMFNILKKLEVDQIVDVYKSVLQTRSRCPQFIDNIGSYIHMYEIVKMFTALHSQRLN